jgi:serine/threonine protein kinase
MSYCLNPNCLSPHNPNDAKFCQWCQTRLLLNDRYRPLDPIGRGGFGRTFKARDEYKPSKPYCVIKQFHGKGFDDAAKAEELFHREAELQEKLGKFPQIPELLALCPQDNYLYLVQEFIDGRNLNQELKEEGTFSEEKVWQLLEDLLPVLQFVHDNQVIHRDIKPENIIRHRADNTLVLVDFGIAKLATEAILAKTGTVIGSEGYTAPEQHEGKPRFTSDLYSLGATCYHLLTYADPSRLLYGWVDWQKELRGKLENRDISDELIEVLTKLLQPDTSQRYQSAEDVLQSLVKSEYALTVDYKLKEAYVTSLTLQTKDYKKALLAISSKMPDSYKRMLVAHYHAPSQIITAYQLAEAARYKGFEGANLQYGKLGKLIAEYCNYTPPSHTGKDSPFWSIILANAYQDEKNKWCWALRPQVAEALEELGWV